MSFINQNVLGYINHYRTTLDQQLSNLLQWVNSQNYDNLFATHNFKLYTLISENIRMDLNYLVSLNPDYDFFGFPGMQRNIRNTIESFYDLYNLTIVDKYLSILKYTSHNSSYSSDEYKDVINIANAIGLKCEKKFGKEYYSITIKTKANIALQNGVDSNIYYTLKKYSTEANSFVHPDIFVPMCEDKTTKLEELLYADTLLLAHSYNLLVVFVNKKYGYTANFNPFIAHQNLLSSLQPNDVIISNNLSYY